MNITPSNIHVYTYYSISNMRCYVITRTQVKLKSMDMKFDITTQCFREKSAQHFKYNTVYADMK